MRNFVYSGFGSGVQSPPLPTVATGNASQDHAIADDSPGYPGRDPFHVAPVFSGIPLPDCSPEAPSLVVLTTAPGILLYFGCWARLCQTIFESFLSYRAFRKGLEIGLLENLGKVIVVTLAVYLVLRIQDLMGRGAWELAFRPTYEARMFLAETLLGILAPIILLVIPRIRTNHFSLFVSAFLVVLGFIMNRLNVSITGMENFAGQSYFSSWTEVSVTSMIVALGFVSFGLAVKHLPVFLDEESGSVVEREASELLAPNVLRQPLQSTTTLVLVLGGLFLVSAVALGYSGFRYRASPSANVGMSVRRPELSRGLEQFKITPDLTFPQTGESPGLVTFRHSSHVDLKQPNCRECHLKQFKILRSQLSVPAGASAGTIDSKRDMHAEERCGGCHNGQKSFSVKEDCQLCHAQ